MDNARLPAGVPLCQPPDSPILPLLATGVDPLLITVLHRLSMRALMRAAVAANLDNTEKLKLLLQPCSGEVCTLTTRNNSSGWWCCSLCAWILTPNSTLGTRWQQSHSVFGFFSLFIYFVFFTKVSSAAALNNAVCTQHPACRPPPHSHYQQS